MASATMVDTPVRFSPDKLRAARCAAGMSQTGLARATGRTETMVRAWERGRSIPSVEALCRIAHVLDLPMDALFERDGGNR